ncbi:MULTISPECIES: hypothetical protein [Methylomonas]|nr:hypothetical protein [Methylomonas koyamae]
MDSDQLKDAALCALKFIEIYTGKDAKTKRYKALRALADMTLNDLERGKSDTECKYTAQDIFLSVTSSKSFEDSDKRNVNRFLKDLHDALPTHEAMLKQIAIDNNFVAIPTYNFSASVGSGSGVYTEHFITPLERNLYDTDIPAEDLKEGEIKYYLESVNNLPLLFRWINNFEISAWRQKLLAFAIIIGILVIVCLFLFFMLVFLHTKNGGLEIIRALFGTLGVSSFIAFPLRHLYLCLTNRIISAPILLLPNTVDNAQIEYVATEKLSPITGRPIRKFRVVIYSSTCPICQSRIEVENGGKEFHNRLIGRCTEVPLEHVYSFDRFLCKGRFLRHL